MEGVPGSPSSGPSRIAGEPSGGGEQRVVGYRIIGAQPPEVEQAERKAKTIARRRHVVDRAYQLLDYAFFVLYGLLGIRVVLAVMAANEATGFVAFIHAMTQPFYGPFEDIVASVPVAGGVLEMSVLIAMLAYLLLHVAVRGLLHVLVGTRRSI